MKPLQITNYQITGLNMKPTTPNKESVRRISVLHNASFCYLLVSQDTPIVQVLTDVKSQILDTYKRELESWCGIEFDVYNNDSCKTKLKEQIKQKGERILPLKLADQ